MAGLGICQARSNLRVGFDFKTSHHISSRLPRTLGLSGMARSDTRDTENVQKPTNLKKAFVRKLRRLTPIKTNLYIVLRCAFQVMHFLRLTA